MLKCIVCDCTDRDPCIDRTGGTCGWVEFSPGVITFNGGGLCSFCAEENPEILEEFGRTYPGLHAALDRGLLKPSDGERDEPLVELVSDAEADRFLRARRVGAC